MAFSCSQLTPAVMPDEARRAGAGRTACFTSNPSKTVDFTYLSQYMDICQAYLYATAKHKARSAYDWPSAPLAGPQRRGESFKRKRFLGSMMK
jgi:hypothetical protein